MDRFNRKYLPKYTYDDYAIWEGNWELINGIPHPLSSAATIQHQRIVSNIAIYLNQLLEKSETCQSFLPIDWKINTFTVVRPDCMVICHTPWKEEGVNYYSIVDPDENIAKVYRLHEGRYIKVCDACS